ncbi:helix-hairpin-helix domain-containing protein [Niallia sp. Krafla_26]|uniref:helix-hairpin-helix domain-containing protein n=1 Tax=Niallia sp. Krafla_26 TaxID=3064703 RepID=UPI003D17B105
MKNIVKQNLVPLLLGIVVLGAIIAYFFIGKNENDNAKQVSNEWFEEETIAETEKEKSDLIEVERIVVDVKGAIRNPGVYEFQTGDRVTDVIENAGGLLENADRDRINQAMRLEDEMVLYFPVIGEESVDQSEATMAQEKDDGKVNLNKASQTELLTLTGIGPSKADAIIQYREENGSFEKIEDLMEISGIGEKTFEKLKDQISIR